MRITNDCLQENTLSIEVNGNCTTIAEIVSQNPITDCDQLKVCIGPELVSLHDLIMDVYDYVSAAQQSNSASFQQLFSQYNTLYNYFIKCCMDIMDRLIKIEKRVNSLVIIRQIIIQPPRIEYPRPRRPFQVYIPKPYEVITEDRFVIDNTLTSGYTEGYERYNEYGKYFDRYVFWLKSQNGFIRRLMPYNIPYPKGSIMSNNWIEGIKSVFAENSIEFDESILKWKNLKNPKLFTIPKLGGKWLIVDKKVYDESGRELSSFLPIVYNKNTEGLVLEKILSYRVDETKQSIKGFEPVLMSYQVKNQKTGTRSIYEGQVYNWLKYS